MSLQVKVFQVVLMRATGGTGLGACLRQLMFHFSGSMDNKQFEDIYQNFYDCLFAFVKV